MNTHDVLKYGNLTFLNTLGGVPKSEWETAGVCGFWSVKQIVAHLTSFEHLVAEVLSGFSEGGPTPHLEMMGKEGPERFNDLQVELRQDKTADEQLAEYKEAHSRVMSLIVQIPEETRRQNGTLPWYGEEYDLDDFLVYINYGHKREHCAQINVFRDELEKG